MTKPLAAQYEVKWLQIINKASCCGRVCVCVCACRPAFLVWARSSGGEVVRTIPPSLFSCFSSTGRRGDQRTQLISLQFSHKRRVRDILTFKLRVRTDDARLVVPFTSTMDSGCRNTSGSLSSLPSVRSRKGGGGKTQTIDRLIAPPLISSSLAARVMR